MEGVWLRWQAGTRKAVNKPNSVAGRSGVTKKMACLVSRTITPPLSRDHNRYIDHPKSSRSRIDKRTARATGNTRYRYSKIAPLDHKMANDCVSLARTNTVSSTITKPIKTWKKIKWKLQLQSFKPYKQNVHTWHFIYNKSGKRG